MLCESTRRGRKTCCEASSMKEPPAHTSGTPPEGRVSSAPFSTACHTYRNAASEPELFHLNIILMLFVLSARYARPSRIGALTVMAVINGIRNAMDDAKYGSCSCTMAVEDVERPEAPARSPYKDVISLREHPNPRQARVCKISSPNCDGVVEVLMDIRRAASACQFHPFSKYGLGSTSIVFPPGTV